MSESNQAAAPIAAVMLGATGAVGGEALKALLPMPSISKISILGRRQVPNLSDPQVVQHQINIFEPQSYSGLLADHDVAICTLGVGQPSKVSKEDFVKIDKTAVLEFAKAAKDAGVQHFQLLSSVGINSTSASFFLRTKGELVEELKALEFDRLSIFQPSMILTQKNRYGLGQWLTLRIWPLLSPLLIGSWQKYRGIKVETLGKAFAANIHEEKKGVEMITWNAINELAS